MPDGLRIVEFSLWAISRDTYGRIRPNASVNLPRNSVACNRSVVVTFNNRNRARSPDETHADDPDAILEALDKTAWNKAKAARLLGIDRVTLYRKIKRYNLTEDTSIF